LRPTLVAVPALVFIRHGETDWNVEARLQGQQNIPLNARGRLQALRNGEMLRQTIPDVAGYDFVASPLDRAGETDFVGRGLPADDDGQPANDSDTQNKTQRCGLVLPSPET